MSGNSGAANVFKGIVVSQFGTGLRYSAPPRTNSIKARAYPSVTSVEKAPRGSAAKRGAFSLSTVFALCSKYSFSTLGRFKCPLAPILAPGTSFLWPWRCPHRRPLVGLDAGAGGGRGFLIDFLPTRVYLQRRTSLSALAFSFLLPFISRTL